MLYEPCNSQVCMHVVKETMRLICVYTRTYAYCMLHPYFAFAHNFFMFLILHFSLFSFLCFSFFHFLFIFICFCNLIRCVAFALLVSMTYIWNKQQQQQKKMMKEKSTKQFLLQWVLSRCKALLKSECLCASVSLTCASQVKSLLTLLDWKANN